MSFERDYRGPQPGERRPDIPLSPGAQITAMRLLRAIYEKTGGRGRAVRDVTELETGLTAEQSKAAWRDLLGLGLIEGFNADYAARMSVKGIEAIQNAPPPTVPPNVPLAGSEAPRQALSRKVFIVRGSDTGAREAVAQFVEQIDFRAIMLHEQAEQGGTIMEQVETHGEAGFAIVLLTPDDLGCTPGGPPEIRPPMDVLMELGFLIGRLGRARVGAFAISSTMDLPTDLAGVVLKSFDASGGWKVALGRGLQAAGHEIDWNKAMNP